MSDRVDHPDYYNKNKSGIECIDVIENYNLCIGTAMKYLWRAGLKKEEGISDKDKHIEDLKKAIWYIQREISRIEREK